MISMYIDSPIFVALALICLIGYYFERRKARRYADAFDKLLAEHREMRSIFEDVAFRYEKEFNAQMRKRYPDWTVSDPVYAKWLPKGWER